jgi:polyhydroxybutyrate depolymerase
MEMSIPKVSSNIAIMGMMTAVVLLVAGWSLRAVAAEPETLPATPRPGTFLYTLQAGGFERVAHVHVPSGYKPDKKPALVLVLHGAGGNGLATLERYGWAAKADRENFVAVAPDGLPARPRQPSNFLTNPPLWNSGHLRPQSPRAAIDDVAYVQQLLDDLREKVPYDERLVFCAGHSNGGGMAFRLATELSDRFTAIGTVAGRMSLPDPHPKRPVPTLYILGTKDPLMPMEGGEVRLPWETHQNPPVAEPLAAWAKALGCETKPETVSERDGLTRQVYRSQTNGPTLSVIYIEGHGHHWPGGKPMLAERMIGPITNKLDATATLWEFFQACGEKATK